MASELRKRRSSPEQADPPQKKLEEKTAAADPAANNSFGADDAERPSTLKVWILASRPHTLTASIAPVIVGYNLVVESSSHCARQSAVAFATFACLIQLATNLHNDYADFVKGADDHRRLGQARATQRGWLTPGQTAGGSTLCLLAAFAIGTYMTWTAGEASGSGTSTFLDPTFTFVTLSSCFNAVAYTGGPYPLGYIGLGNVSIAYAGLGDLFAFLYFGLVATLGVPYHCLRMERNHDSLVLLFARDGGALHVPLLAALPVGFLATAIIVVNNLRDRNTDVDAHKRTMAVRFGASFTRKEYAALVFGSYAVVAVLSAKLGTPLLLLPLLSFPAAIPQLRAVAFGGKDGSDLNDHVGGTARVQLLFCLLLSLGLNLSSR